MPQPQTFKGFSHLDELEKSMAKRNKPIQHAEVYKQCQKQGRITMYAILETEECQKQPITEL
uniref:Uncharacterized protein n=1 Tax=Solanum tuberosum TaxID=4113 RepID=M1CF47_SOLTU